ncbi:MAG: hypothetical protein AMS17_16415 [Spirochaetes bacterium DG_61]|nr:MAG: hypothetical protein AMS17_16415 [Spirochaetes bacterium DG_61]
MLRRLNAARLVKKGTCLTRKNVDSFIERIKDVIRKNGRCVIAVTGSPGSGKSVYADFFRKKGFFSFPKDSVSVIDDLRGNNDERYSRKELSIGQDKNILLIFDYRAVLYYRGANFIVILDIGEKKRLENLKNRSMKSYKRYKGFYYRYPPMPFYVDSSRVYILKDDTVELFKG